LPVVEPDAKKIKLTGALATERGAGPRLSPTPRELSSKQQVERLQVKPLNKCKQSGINQNASLHARYRSRFRNGRDVRNDSREGRNWRPDHE
jgi:hypothetical protein